VEEGEGGRGGARLVGAARVTEAKGNVAIFFPVEIDTALHIPPI
jgi:hypothetical protein